MVRAAGAPTSGAGAAGTVVCRQGCAWPADEPAVFRRILAHLSRVVANSIDLASGANGANKISLSEPDFPEVFWPSFTMSPLFQH
jgi:hypothetical protein